MRHLFNLITRPLACCAVVSCLATAAQAEPALQTTLGPGYVLVPTFDFASIDATPGTVLTFSLIGEATGWSATQTFSVIDGDRTTEIFAGAATAGDVVRYVVRDSIGGVSFDSHSADAQQYAPGGADADYWVLTERTGGSTAYAFAYEDYHYGATNDHNDMVIGLGTASSVPEAGTLAMLLSGLSVVMLYLHRRH